MKFKFIVHIQINMTAKKMNCKRQLLNLHNFSQEDLLALLYQSVKKKQVSYLGVWQTKYLLLCCL